MYIVKSNRNISENNINHWLEYARNDLREDFEEYQIRHDLDYLIRRLHIENELDYFIDEVDGKKIISLYLQDKYRYEASYSKDGFRYDKVIEHIRKVLVDYFGEGMKVFGGE